MTARRNTVLFVASMVILCTVAGAILTKRQSVHLPFWAPKDPSSEFVKAATVLEPVSSTVTPPSSVALSWECFGALTDQQAKALIDKHAIVIKPAMMTSEQKETFDKLVNDDGMQSALHKAGALSDLSHINFRFSTNGPEVTLELICAIQMPQMPGTFGCASISAPPFASVAKR